MEEIRDCLESARSRKVAGSAGQGVVISPDKLSLGSDHLNLNFNTMLPNMHRGMLYFYTYCALNHMLNHVSNMYFQ